MSTWDCGSDRFRNTQSEVLWNFMCEKADRNGCLADLLFFFFTVPVSFLFQNTTTIAKKWVYIYILRALFVFYFT